MSGDAVWSEIRMLWPEIRRWFTGDQERCMFFKNDPLISCSAQKMVVRTVDPFGDCNDGPAEKERNAEGAEDRRDDG